MLPSTLLWACIYSSASIAAVFKVGQKFQIILDSIPNLTASPKVVPGDAAVFDIDLFDTDAATISGLQSQGKIVICYFSAGTYEPWRPDAGNFTQEDMGQSLAPEWPDEYWLRVNNSNVKKIMTNRIQLAAAKGCDGVDPDNTDGYQNPNNTINLTRGALVEYMRWMASQASSLNLAIGLKNSMDILPDLTPIMQFAVNEQCAAFGECSSYSAFLAAGKPVFHIEYPPSVPNVQPADRAKGCQNNGMNGMSTVFKNMSLSGWVGYCDGSSATTITKPGGGTNPWAPGKPKPTTTAKTTARPTTTKPPSTSRTSTRSTTSVRTTSSAAPGGSNGCKSKHWDQCGGNDWKGCTVCESPYTCKGVSPPYYYQCL
ncbi:glycoside hydrolase superfamily [Cadophora sp. MPI-SDFR-AT-0126]|nr:glycoside hydrolase superfamily [Leotiomycetes sp. MPI-SDFR-AT-0126]